MSLNRIAKASGRRDSILLMVSVLAMVFGFLVLILLLSSCGMAGLSRPCAVTDAPALPDGEAFLDRGELLRERDGLLMDLDGAEKCASCVPEDPASDIDLYLILTMHPYMADDLASIGAALEDLERRAIDRGVASGLRFGLGASTDSTWRLSNGQRQTDYAHLVDMSFEAAPVLSALAAFRRLNSDYSADGGGLQLREERQLTSIVHFLDLRADKNLREDAAKVLILVTDEPFMDEEYSKSIGAGDHPEDGKADNGIFGRDREWAPSRELVRRLLNESDMLMIFAVTAEHLDLYKELAEGMDRAVVVELAPDASNFEEIILGSLEELCL